MHPQWGEEDSENSEFRILSGNQESNSPAEEPESTESLSSREFQRSPPLTRP
jgi:hypothetical protein